MRKPSKKKTQIEGKQFSRNLKKLRMQAGLTQAQLAYKTETTVASVSRWELDPSIGITKKNLEKLANALGTSIGELVENQEDPGDLDLPQKKLPPSKLRKLRLQAGLTQKQFANKIGVNTSYISQIETNPFTQPTYKILQRIAQILRKPISEFWDNSWERKDLTEKQRVLLRAYKQFQTEDRLKLLKELKRFEEEKKRTEDYETKSLPNT